MRARRPVIGVLWNSGYSLPTAAGGCVCATSRFWMCRADNHREHPDRSDAHPLHFIVETRHPVSR